MDPIRRSVRSRIGKKKSDHLYFDPTKFELNEQERDLIYPNEKGQEKRYCFCRRTEEEAVGLTMIECDSCHDWFHDECLGRRPEELELLDYFYCPGCSAKPVKYQKRSQPSNADIELLLTALAELDEEKPKSKKKEPRVTLPKVSLYHFLENSNKSFGVFGYIKNESSSSIDENRLIIPITKEDVYRGCVWTQWGNYRIVHGSDGKLQASTEVSSRGIFRGQEEKSDSPAIVADVLAQLNEGSIILNVPELEPLKLPRKNFRFQFDAEKCKRILDANKSIEKIKLEYTDN